MNKRPTRTGGWPKRDREAIALRVDPALADWYARAAAGRKTSRNQLIEDAMQAIRDAIDATAEWEAKGQSPLNVVEDLGVHLVGRLIKLGLMNDQLASAWPEFVAEQHRLNREVADNQRHGIIKRGGK